jgi:hypothetical protein
MEKVSKASLLAISLPDTAGIKWDLKEPLPKLIKIAGRYQATAR